MLKIWVCLMKVCEDDEDKEEGMKKMKKKNQVLVIHD
jgi:hypothetical protein